MSLLRCPFCGSNKLENLNGAKDGGQVMCVSCGACGPRIERLKMSATVDIADGIEAWNMRHGSLAATVYPVLDASAVMLARARKLYVDTVTRRERDACTAIDGHLARRYSPMNVRRLATAKEALGRAEAQSVEIFNAVMRGEVAP